MGGTQTIIYSVILKIFIFNVKLKIFSKVSINRSDTKIMRGVHFKILTVVSQITNLKEQTKSNDDFIASDLN